MILIVLASTKKLERYRYFKLNGIKCRYSAKLIVACLNWRSYFDPSETPFLLLKNLR